MKHTIPTNDDLNAFAQRYVAENMPKRRTLDDTDVFGLVNRTIKTVSGARVVR